MQLIYITGKKFQIILISHKKVLEIKSAEIF